MRCEKAESALPPEAALEALAAQPGPAMLESSALDERYGRYSVLGCRPARIIRLVDGRLADSDGRDLPGTTVLEALRAALSVVTADGTLPIPYGPGWIGYIGYEFGRHIERLPGRAVRDTALPDLHLALYDALAVYDAIDRHWRLTWLDYGRGEPPALAILRGILGARQDAGNANHVRDAGVSAPILHGNFTPDRYRRAIARCLDYITAGDIFQVNLSQRFTVPNAPPPLAIYRALRARNPAWYSAMLLGEGWAVLSSSPELFLRRRGHDILTRPIKGTRPRTGRENADAAAAAELLASPKDNAELAMIIDLLRNDLGRVCRYGTVRVANPRELEAHPTVFHLVGSVVGQLRADVDMVDLLAATFPGGSITGAPKIRAMEIIDELEGLARGVYTGAIGWLGVNGDCELNIAIRTIVCERGNAHVQVGGGIVADSTPEGEYQETLDKARALMEAIGEAGNRH